MSPDQPFAESQDPTAPLRRAFNALLNHGRDLFTRTLAAIAHGTTAHLPRRFAANPVAAEQRITRTLDWIYALARTLAGDTNWLRTPTYLLPAWPHRFPPFTAKLREECGLPPVPPRTEAQKAAAHLWYVRKVFATQPVARIAKRLARRLGITEASDFWPRELLEIQQTPAAWAKAAHAKQQPATPPAPPNPIPPPLASPAPPGHADPPEKRDSG